MLEFNNNDIFTGYLKQLLAEFNLPKYKVYTKENAIALQETGAEQNIIESVPVELEGIRHKRFIDADYDANLRYVPYIKDDKIQIYTKVNGKLQWVQKNNQVYNYNKKYLNFTKNLLIKNNIYDTYTHNYLGDFLRFQRDYNDINLMPLYNCFSNELVTELKINKTTRYNYYKKAEKIEPGKTYRLFIPFNSNDDFAYKTDVTVDVEDVNIIDYTTIAQTHDGAILPAKLEFELIKGTQIKNINRIRFNIDTKEFYLFGPNDIAYKLRTSNKDEQPEKMLGIMATFKINAEVMPGYIANLKSVLGNYLYDQESQDVTISFETSDKHYKYYSVPVKLFNKYTIAMDSKSQIELCCGVYNKYQGSSEKFDGLIENTYVRCAKTNFTTPFIYDKLTKLTQDSAYMNNLIMQEDDLRLFIKVPEDYNSTIVILEGDYLGYNDVLKTGDNLIKNHSVINFENIEYQQIFKPITKLQLLSVNSNKSYPFADRLVEYLSGNVITHLDKNGDNVIRVQKLVELEKDDDTLQRVKTVYPGLWNKEIQLALYQFANTDRMFINKDLSDILGYCDKDIEKYYSANINKKTANNGMQQSRATISDIDIYTEIYQDTYKDYTREK